MIITLNGEKKHVPIDSTVSALVPKQKLSAVALNGMLVPRNLWDTTHVSEGDHLDVLIPMQGG